MSHINELVIQKMKWPKNDEEDYISNLPDDVTSHILSYLPTICVFRMPILSKEWACKWTHVHTIDILDERFRGHPLHGEGDAKFIHYMNKVTSLAKNVQNVCLQLFKDYDINVVKPWISALLSNQIKVLYVSTVHKVKYVVIPVVLINSASLIYMVLKGPVFSVPSMNCFANLRLLQLEHLLISNEDSGNEALVFVFHVLETFHVSYCNWLGIKVVEIRAPALVTFVYEKLELGDITFNLQSDRLTKFTSRGSAPDGFFLTGSSKVASANFMNYDEDLAPKQESGAPILRLLKEFSYTVEFLTLSFYATEAIMESMELIQGVSLTRCAKLKRLVLINNDYNMHIRSGNTEDLLELLQVMPYLKCLHLDVTAWNDFDYEAVKSLPSCITNSLEKIEFGNIVESYTEAQYLRLAKFLLKTTLNLKEFHVYVENHKELEDYIMSKILAYPTGSRCVKFSVHREDNSILPDDDISATNLMP